MIEAAAAPAPAARKVPLFALGQDVMVRWEVRSWGCRTGAGAVVRSFSPPANHPTSVVYYLRLEGDRPGLEEAFFEGELEALP